MKRRQAVAESESPPEVREIEKNDFIPEREEASEAQRLFLLEDGELKPFSENEYTSSTLYEVAESFVVECRYVRPDDPGNLVIEGKRPSKRSVPILITKSGGSVLLESWDKLEAEPERLAEVKEVIGAIPVKQIFVLKRK